MLSWKENLKQLLHQLDIRSRRIFILSTGCCQVEIENLQSSSYDWSRLGVETITQDPREANLLVVSGWIVPEMAEKIKEVYSLMSGDKAVIAVGACSISGSPFSKAQKPLLASDILPVDVYVPGCPPRPEAIIEAIQKIEKSKMGKTNHEKVIYGALKEL